MIRFSATITCQYDTPFAPFPASEYEQALDWVRDSGFDAAELCISHYNSLDIEKIKGGLDARKLGCSTISTGQARTLENISLIDDDADARQRAVQRMLQHVDAAAVLGSKVTMGLLRGLGDINRLEQQKETLKRSMEPILGLAEKKGVTVILEAINRYETAMFNSARETLDFIEEIGNPACLGILWDLFHANIEDPDFLPAIDAMGERLQHIHLADSNRMLPGYGHMDIGSVYDHLVKTGYSEYISYECFNRPSLETMRREAGTYIAGLKQR